MIATIDKAIGVWCIAESADVGVLNEWKAGVLERVKGKLFGLRKTVIEDVGDMYLDSEDGKKELKRLSI